MHILDVHEHCFKVVHEHIFFALFKMRDPLREHTFDFSKSRSYSCSWTCTYLMFMNIVSWSFMNIYFLPFCEWVPMREHKFDVSKSRSHSCSWTSTYLTFLNVILRSLMNIYFLPFLECVIPWESTHLMFLNPGVIAVHEQALTWCSWTLF